METPLHTHSRMDTYRKGFLCALIVSAIIGSGLGYGKIYLFHFVLAAASIFSTYYTISTKGWANLKWLVIPFALLGFMALSLAWADDVAAGIKQILITGLGIALLSNIIILTKDKNDLFLMLKTVCVMLIICCCIGGFEMATGINWPWSRNSRFLYLFDREIFLTYKKFRTSDVELIRHSPTAFFWNPNNLAVFVTCFFPFVLFSKYKSWVSFSLTALITLIILGAGARMCAWALMIMLPFWMIFFRKKIQMKLAASLCLFLFFISLNVFIWQLPIHMFNQFKLPYGELIFGEPKLDDQGNEFQFPIAEEENSISFRKEMIGRSLNLFVENPILGTGAGGIEHEFTHHKTQSGLVDLHFYWLELLVNYGSIWFIAFAVVIIYLLLKIRKKNTWLSWGILFSAVLFFPCAIALSSAVYYLPGYLLLAALILCYKIPYRDEDIALR